MQNGLRTAGWLLMTLLSCLLVVIVSRYFTLDPEVFFPEQREVYQANLVMLLLSVGDFTFEEAYISVAWISWVPNLIVAELYLQRCPVAGPAAK